MTDWPWSETLLQRRSHIAHLYRDALLDHAPHACDYLDKLLDGYGQHWITGNRLGNPDEPMTVKEIADWSGVTINAIYNRIATHHISPAGYTGADGSKKYRKTYLLSDFKTNHTV